MLITPDFVLINMPMTGATVVAEMLRCVYGDAAVDVGRKHATCAEVPEGERHKPLLAVFRSPFERYVSQYHYGCWRDEHERYSNTERIRQDYPDYPNITFKQFVRIANAHYPDSTADERQGPVSLGWHTRQYVRFYCRDSDAVLDRIERADSNSDAETLRRSELPVRFLTGSAGRLADALRDYLRELEVGDDALHRLDQFAVPRRHLHEVRLQRDAAKYYDEALTAYVLERERLLFERFPQELPGPAPRTPMPMPIAMPNARSSVRPPLQSTVQSAVQSTVAAGAQPSQQAGFAHDPSP